MNNSKQSLTLTRQQMVEMYPNQWIGIRNIKYKDNGINQSDIDSADLVYTDMTASELAMMAIRGDDIRPFYTTPDDTFQIGAI